MKEPQIHIFENSEALAHFFGRLLMQSCAGKKTDEFVSIALSGGSTPRAVFEYLSEYFSESIDWCRIKVFWGDERCVPPDDPESNYKMALKSLLEKVPVPPGQIFRIRGEANASAEAARYESLVIQQLSADGQTPEFDLMMLGLGDDGHTASIFPNASHLFESNKLFETALHPVSGQARITATGRLINNAKTIVFIATGEAKADMVAKITRQMPGSCAFPASRVLPLNGEVLWLLDQAAASTRNTKNKST
ncbi:MAG: 6-phosphogluconolactonase [Bacteroidetes bacterium]|nr:6-phosphogluconolactonase [Bacteroidota bacterium]